jgi:hypothetical protein
MMVKETHESPLKSVDQIFAGDAIFTVANPEGERYTFRVARPRTTRQDRFYVSHLNGPDNTSDYKYMGIVVREDLSIQITARSAYRIPETGNADWRGILALSKKSCSAPKQISVFLWALYALNTGNIPQGYKIMHAGRCLRCGRILTVPESIETGIGPECLKKMQGLKT